MAKAEKKTETVTTTSYVLELSEDEAKALAGLLYCNVAGVGEVRENLTRIGNNLSSVMDNQYELKNVTTGTHWLDLTCSKVSRIGFASYDD